MLEKLVADPFIFYSVFAILCVIVFVVIALIINKIKKALERKKLKNTSDKILTEHYEEPVVTTLEEEINKLEEKAKQNEISESPVVETVEKENSFIINEPIQIEISSDVENDIDFPIEKEEKTPMESILSKMQEDLTKKDEASILEFEQEQEQNAIISYQELLKANGKDVEEPKKPKFDLNEFFDNMSSSSKHSYDVKEIEDAKDLSVITIDEVNDDDKNIESNFKDEVEEFKNIINTKNQATNNIEIDVPEEEKKFKMSEFISPIYGRMDAKLDYPKIPNDAELQEKAMSDLTDDEFLKVLKAFRDNL